MVFLQNNIEYAFRIILDRQDRINSHLGLSLIDKIGLIRI